MYPILKALLKFCGTKDLFKSLFFYLKPDIRYLLKFEFYQIKLG